MAKVGLYLRLHARSGKEEELAAFLASSGPIANDEPGTEGWFAVRFDQSTFAIFDVFVDEAGRNAHLSGNVAAALMAKASELLVEAPRIEKHDVVAGPLRC